MILRSRGSERGRATTFAAALVALVALVVVLTLGSSCSATTEGAAPAASSAASTVAPTVAPATAPGGSVVGRSRLEGFAEVTIKVVDADGVEREHCLLLADTEPLRERGLMYVTDATLGGYDGMVFLFPEDNDSAFWMKNTRLPLSIAYVAANGRTVSTTDMAPCPDAAKSCPSYPSNGTYRYAVEVPQGRLGDIGLSTGSTMTVGEHSCAGLPPD